MDDHFISLASEKTNTVSLPKGERKKKPTKILVRIFKGLQINQILYKHWKCNPWWKDLQPKRDEPLVMSKGKGRGGDINVSEEESKLKGHLADKMKD